MNPYCLMLTHPHFPLIQQKISHSREFLLDKDPPCTVFIIRITIYLVPFKHAAQSVVHTKRKEMQNNVNKNQKLQYLFQTQVCCSQIQNRRYNAIVKRLHCQLMKAQSGHRQLSDDIYRMEREIQDLKRHLEVP